MTKTLSLEDLRQFSGSEHWYRHGTVPGVLYMDGAKYVADAGGAYWLLDEIALAQRFNRAVATEQFQVWTLTLNDDDRSAELTCHDGNNVRVFAIPLRSPISH
ncbi:MAG: hypothetical protein JO323_25845 [Acidobacteriia bacterium]|nr:hypothetical protein [Terriglobia bacterium]